jgi:hypothetical protein
MFPLRSPYGRSPLRPATRDEVRDALGYALRFTCSGKSHRHASEMMARIAADVLLEQLEVSGYVVMKKPERPTLDQMLDTRLKSPKTDPA